MSNKLSDIPSSDTSPTITLRKGNVVLKIPNSAAIIRKIDEMFPKTSYYSWNSIKQGRERSDAEKTRQREWINSAQNWFRQEFFGGTGEFEVVVEEEPSTQPITEDKEKYFKPNTEYQPEPKTSVQATNKNAYEIRLDVLKEALGFIQWKTDTVRDVNDSQLPIESLPTSETVINLAQQFYKFVENKR